MWPWRPPCTVHPLGENTAEEGGKEKFLARQRQLRAAPYLSRANPGCYGAGRGVSSQQNSRAEAKGAGCGLGRPLLPAGPAAALGPREPGGAGPDWEPAGEHRPAPGGRA